VTVTWSPAALSDVARIYDYIASFNPAAAQRLARRLLDAGDLLEEFPERGRPTSAGTRELLIVWPYALVYEIKEFEVQVLRVWHGAQER
jgi:toxin ParE1/3/4